MAKTKEEKEIFDEVSFVKKRALQQSQKDISNLKFLEKKLHLLSPVMQSGDSILQGCLDGYKWDYLKIGEKRFQKLVRLTFI